MLYPTGECFDDAAKFFCSIGYDDLEQYRVVHAIAHFPETGQPFAHAWVERGELVFETKHLEHPNGPKTVVCFDRAEFIKRLRVQDFTRYSMRDLLIQAERSDCSGPWEERYRALCRDSGVDQGTEDEERGNQRDSQQAFHR